MSSPSPPSPSGRAAVLGSPIGHSLSPVLHAAAYRALGLDWDYRAIEVDGARLASFLDGLDDSWVGLSLTMPLKQDVVPLLDRLHGVAEQLSVVNTVVFEHGPGGTVRHGYNTDGYGVAAALSEAGVASAEPAVVLGSGATALSALAGLADLGCAQVRVVARRPDAVRELAARAAAAGIEVIAGDWARPSLDEARVVVSTVPVAGQHDLVTRLGECRGVLLDAVYEPWPTPLAAAWSARGAHVVDGARMLLHQGARQVELFTSGRTAPLRRMDEALTAARLSRT